MYESGSSSRTHGEPTASTSQRCLVEQGSFRLYPLLRRSGGGLETLGSCDIKCPASGGVDERTPRHPFEFGSSPHRRLSPAGVCDSGQDKRPGGGITGSRNPVALVVGECPCTDLRLRGQEPDRQIRRSGVWPGNGDS